MKLLISIAEWKATTQDQDGEEKRTVTVTRANGEQQILTTIEGERFVALDVAPGDTVTVSA